MLQLIGLSAGILSIVGYLPYLRDILRRTTKPERASWFIWSILGSIAFFSQLAEGATWSLWLTAFETFSVLIIFILSLKYGVGGLQKRDIIALIVSSIGLVLWYQTRHAFIALYITIIIDMMGAILTVVKAYEEPESETFSIWLIVAIAGLLSMISVGRFNVVLLSYPFYIFLANFSVVVAMLFGRSRRKI